MADGKKRGDGKPFAPGVSGNPGGLTKHQAARKSTLRAFLFSEPITEAWKKTLRQKLEDGDTTTLLWVGDQVLGKAKASLELSEDPERPLLTETAEAIIAALKGGQS
ncbi:MAG TPA: hypothetical protein PLT35_09540 [Vicinamibacterales bacterium]|nr:hypothetical protein [Vicinamibacterales bacterium]